MKSQGHDDKHRHGLSTSYHALQVSQVAPDLPALWRLLLGRDDGPHVWSPVVDRGPHES